MDKIYCFAGLDVSLNHVGICLLDAEGKMPADGYAFVTPTKKFVTADPEHGVLYRAPSARSDDPNHYVRIEYFVDFILQHLNGLCPFGAIQIVGIEGYALQTKNTRLYETAEMTGAIKRDVVHSGRPLRVHDPDTLKLFAVNYGHATKQQLYDEFAEQTGLSVPTTLLKEGSKRVLSGPGTDVADAYFLARITWMEHQLRTAQQRLQDLPPYLSRIFTRETKAYPLNLLERPYAQRQEKTDA